MVQCSEVRYVTVWCGQCSAMRLLLFCTVSVPYSAVRCSVVQRSEVRLQCGHNVSLSRSSVMSLMCEYWRCCAVQLKRSDLVQ